MNLMEMNNATKEMISMIISDMVCHLAISQKNETEFYKNVRTKYKDLMFLCDMDPKDYEEWVYNAMYDFHHKPEYENHRLDNPDALDICLIVKQHRKELQRKRKQKKKEGK